MKRILYKDLNTLTPQQLLLVLNDIQDMNYAINYYIGFIGKLLLQSKSNHAYTDLINQLGGIFYILGENQLILSDRNKRILNLLDSKG